MIEHKPRMWRGPVKERGATDGIRKKHTKKPHFPIETWNKLNTAWMDNTTFRTLTEVHQHASIPQRRKTRSICMLACVALLRTVIKSWVTFELQLHTILVEATGWRLLGNTSCYCSKSHTYCGLHWKIGKVHDARCRIFEAWSLTTLPCTSGRTKTAVNSCYFSVEKTVRMR